jgi:coatomer protein complex subunit alpha (xenin)
MKMFLARSAAFIGKTKLVRVKENRELEVYNYDIDQTFTIQMPDLLLLDKVFNATGGKVIFYSNL